MSSEAIAAKNRTHKDASFDQQPLQGRERGDYERALLERPELSDPAHRVLSAILSFCRGKADCFPTTAAIARKVGKKVRQVQNILADREEAGEIRCFLDASLFATNEHDHRKGRRRIIVVSHPNAAKIIAEIEQSEFGPRPIKRTAKRTAIHQCVDVGNGRYRDGKNTECRDAKNDTCRDAIHGRFRDAIHGIPPHPPIEAQNPFPFQEAQNSEFAREESRRGENSPSDEREREDGPQKVASIQAAPRGEVPAILATELVELEVPAPALAKQPCGACQRAIDGLDKFYSSEMLKAGYRKHLETCPNSPGAPAPALEVVKPTQEESAAIVAMALGAPAAPVVSPALAAFKSEAAARDAEHVREARIRAATAELKQLSYRSGPDVTRRAINALVAVMKPLDTPGKDFEKAYRQVVMFVQEGVLSRDAVLGAFLGAMDGTADSPPKVFASRIDRELDAVGYQRESPRERANHKRRSGVRQ